MPRRRSQSVFFSRRLKEEGEGVKRKVEDGEEDNEEHRRTKRILIERKEKEGERERSMSMKHARSRISTW